MNDFVESWVEVYCAAYILNCYCEFRVGRGFMAPPRNAIVVWLLVAGFGCGTQDLKMTSCEPHQESLLSSCVARLPSIPSIFPRILKKAESCRQQILVGRTVVGPSSSNLI